MYRAALCSYSIAPCWSECYMLISRGGDGGTNWTPTQVETGCFYRMWYKANAKIATQFLDLVYIKQWLAIKISSTLRTLFLYIMSHILLLLCHLICFCLQTQNQLFSEWPLVQGWWVTLDWSLCVIVLCYWAVNYYALECSNITCQKSIQHTSFLLISFVYIVW